MYTESSRVGASLKSSVIGAFIQGVEHGMMKKELDLNPSEGSLMFQSRGSSRTATRNGSTLSFVETKMESSLPLDKIAIRQTALAPSIGCRFADSSVEIAHAWIMHSEHQKAHAMCKHLDRGMVFKRFSGRWIRKFGFGGMRKNMKTRAIPSISKRC